ncbi:Dabb family protein [Flavobacteriaceae bacterium]|nr:Dabb family protein [Flavobacteriaceae bacterium]MDA9015865.1 Dabb family protein [Flavobacteriaceae bacterium]MDB3861948.1 Dabb family protein [Flavobacteriaceae bacterium]
MALNSIQNTTGPLLHVVFFWLKEPNNKAHRAEFETAIKKLIDTNPQATANHLGCPAASEKRDVVDNSFTYCYTMSFPNLEAQNTYQTDPTHNLFIEEASHLWERVVVSDSIAVS